MKKQKYEKETKCWKTKQNKSMKINKNIRNKNNQENNNNSIDNNWAENDSLGLLGTFSWVLGSVSWAP